MPNPAHVFLYSKCMPIVCSMLLSNHCNVVFLCIFLLSKALHGVEDVPMFQHKQRPPLNNPEDPENELSPSTPDSNLGRKASFNPSTDEEGQEEEVIFHISSNLLLSLYKMFKYELMML